MDATRPRAPRSPRTSRCCVHAGISAVVVHGGGPQVTRGRAAARIETTFVDGLRVTDAETPRRRHDGAGRQAQHRRRGLARDAAVSPAVGLSGVDGGLLLARQQARAPDLGFVGEVVHVRRRRPARARSIEGFVPVVASIAVDENGQAYNVNADVVASELAIALGAEKLVFINDVPGLIGPDGRPALGAVGRAVPAICSPPTAWSTAA